MTRQEREVHVGSKTMARVREYASGVVAAAFLLVPATGHVESQHTVETIPVGTTFNQLITDEDTDGDRKITVDDTTVTGTERGNKRFSFFTVDRRRREVEGTYPLSNLLQELQLLLEAGRDTAGLDMGRVYEQPVDRISRSIRERYWDGLTRRIDETGLPAMLRDDKTSAIDGKSYLYVPASDMRAFEYYDGLGRQNAEWNLRVNRLPPRLTPEYVQSRNGYPGILTLALTEGQAGSAQGVPFVVPGGRFNEMYGWDSYFIILGLLQDGRVELARSIVENFVYEVTHYGAVLNANRTYYLTRSQPPFLTSMALEVCEHLPADSLRLLWLRKVLEAAVHEYRTVWTNPEHMTSTGLSRYFDTGTGPPPEVEPGHFDAVFAEFAARRGMDARAYELAYRTGKIRESELDEFFIHDRAMRESGHDTSYRLYGRCADLATVDLNSLLYKIELDIATVLEREFGGSITPANGMVERSTDWFVRAAKRKENINKYLWDPERGMFFDYNVRTGERVTYVSATTLYPLWASLATLKQARSIVGRALPLLEMPGGVVSSTEESRGPISADHLQRQWDYPFGWAPHQMLTWHALDNYGFGEAASRLAYKWLYTITLNASHYNGTVTEKYDVVRRSHEVFAEYGNVGTKFSYITREGFGWTNASFQTGLSLLNPEQRSKLNRLIPPEHLFDPQR